MAYSKLEAVNTMLLESGEHIVNDLNSDQGVDTSVAQFLLEQTIKLYMGRGLANNSYVATLTPTTQGRIMLPTGTYEAQAVETIYDPIDNAVISTGIKSNPLRLFNLTKQTDIFPVGVAVKVNVTFEILWDDINVNLQKAIIATAARDYQRITQGDSSLDRALAEKELRALSRGRAADIHNKRRSLFTYLNPWKDIRWGK